MAAKKHKYTITFNQRSAGKDPMPYRFGQTACALSTSSGRASVSFEMGTLKTHDELIHSTPLVMDAMRRMHLCYAMRHDRSLRITRIYVSVDGEEKMYDRTAPGFPFLFNMMSSTELHLPDSWRDPDFQRAVWDTTKSRSADEARYACLFSFLAGIGKEYEIEKFTCYWTAMNAHYNYLAVSQNAIAAANGGKKVGENNDTAKISALLRVLGCGDRKTGRDAMAVAYRDLTYAFRRIGRDDLPQLYRELSDNRTDRAYLPATPVGDAPNLTTHLQTILPEANMSAYGCLLLDYPYYMRCKYLHGGHTTPLFASIQDPEVAAFRVVNYFIEEYLKEAIPGMFAPDWLSPAKYDAIQQGI